MIVEYLIMGLIVAGAFGWAVLWMRTYHPDGIKGLLLHNLLFLGLSLLIAGGVLLLIFLPADDSYSASNLGALGILFLMFLRIFGTACFVALMGTIGMLVQHKHPDPPEKEP